jgi:hypothetical protein
MNPTLRQLLPPLVCWTARLTGLALFLLVVATAAGEGPPPSPFTVPFPVAIQFVLMGVMTVGLVVAWQWEVGGAMATLAALLAFNVVELAVNQRPAAGAFPLFAVPALLYLLSARLRHVQVPPDPAT